MSAELAIRFVRPGCEPTDEELMLQVVYDICGMAGTEREEEAEAAMNSGGCHCLMSGLPGIPVAMVRRVAKLIVGRFALPVPESRVDEWVEWQRGRNRCWVPTPEQVGELHSLSRTEGGAT